MYCTNCGIENPNTSNFCHACSTKICAGTELIKNNKSDVKNHLSHQNRLNEEVTKYYGVKGWLLFLCVSMTIISPLIAIGTLTPHAIHINENWLEYTYNTQNVLIANLCAVVILITLSIYCGASLWRAKVGSDQHTKYLLLASVAYATISPFVFLYYAKMSSESRAIFVLDSVKDFLTILLSSIIWHLYLTKSRRVRFTIPRYNTHVRCPDCRKLTPSASTICVHCGCKLVNPDATPTNNNPTIRSESVVYSSDSHIESST